jgi:hypothetical protein
MANPAANLFLLDLANPYRYLEIRGYAEITPDDDYSFADKGLTRSLPILCGQCAAGRISSCGDRRRGRGMRPTAVWLDRPRRR